MDDDDRPIGRILTRREVLALFAGSAALACAPSAVTPAASAAVPAPTAAASTAAVATVAPPAATGGAAAAVPSCVVRPELTEGPYFIDEKLQRSDIRSDPSDNSVRPGAPLVLTFNVSRVTGSSCATLAGAMVDVWHCDAQGAYSDVSDPGGSTRGKKFLRGYQTTDASGRAQFTTIYPGWYQGRAVHIHFKIRTTTGGRTQDFTSQLFFDEALNDRVFAQAPYAQRGGAGRTRNERDGIYTGSGGKLLLSVTQTATGYAATFDIGLSA